MDIYRAIYTSQPFGFDSAILGMILLDAERANRRDDITGALICRADIYLQWLEGPEPAVRAALARIARDDRHLNMKMRVEGPIPERLFGAWAMLHDPSVSWIWTQSEVADGAADRATPEQIEAFFPPLRAEADARAAG